MYASGRWRGFWDQAGLGRQAMRELLLQFSSGQIEGHGLDTVGPFTFHGTYDGIRNVTLLKKYRHHEVDYQGSYDGEGTIFGEWSIGVFWRGQFALTPERFSASADTPIEEIVASPYAGQ
jgi:hypothetical protein